MGVTWTEEQKQVIGLRDRNLLVSAAAGSGKTAVLVERIVQKVLDAEHPVDIDRMLVVTFTKAAAAEMRERVSRAIEKKMEQQPYDSGLQRQYTLVHNAQITTIDSFCLYVVRNYFHTIQLEPSFRIADAGELALLKADAAEEVMERQYQQKDPGFLQLADRYASAKSDAALVDFMLKLYDFSQSYPWPREWLASLAQQYRIADTGALHAKPWMQELLQYTGHVLDGLQKQARYARALCLAADGPQMYLAAVEDDLALLEQLCACGSFEAYTGRFSALKFTKLGVNRRYGGSVQKQEQVKEIRKKMKDSLAKLRDSYFYQDAEAVVSDIEKILPDVEALAQLAQAFAEAYQAKKEERGILDFSDIEHSALKILIDEQTKKPTAAAEELRGIYEEIMIDEYQDSNYVQETILRAVSREADGQNNIFMVGDVKQSIYRFRLARPELFIEKYKSYTAEESSRQKIDLHKNFRSRTEVVESVNHIFYRIMHEDVGNVEYDSKAALYAGAVYPKAPAADSKTGSHIDPAGLFQSELLLAQASQEELEQAGMRGWQELEARMTAARIKELLETQQVTDKESGALRPVRCRDIVILLRSMTGWADTFSKVLAQAGIPAHTALQAGYFGTPEIRTILSMLSILDNPLQDIPLAAVLASAIGGMNGAQLAQIKAAGRGHFFYQALLDYAENGGAAEDAQAQALHKKAVRFLAAYEKLRSLTPYTPVHKLIQAVLEETGYASYIQAMPAGAQRRANVDMLLEKAAAYEKTSYKGLFHFVRYIEKLKKYEIDFGEADITSENEDVVRIMSIHKSKGLEFPVVFVCGMNKQFNRQDIRSRLILHPEHGIGLDYIDAEKRIRKSGFIKKVLENEIRIENQGEELRILYVALTRAEEKLILTGAVKEELKEPQQSGQDADGAFYEMDYFGRCHASSYLDWVYPCAAQSPLFALRTYRPQDVQLQEAAEAAMQKLDRLQVRGLYRTADKKLYEALDAELSWVYPHAGDTDLKTKISVSELKRGQDAEEEFCEVWFPQEKESAVPAFLRKEQPEENRAALRGSAVHKIMEEIDFVRSKNSADRTADVRSQIAHMLAQGHITQEMKALVSPRMLARFLESPLAERMALAQQQGGLHKEQPFVMGIPASRIYEGAGTQLVLIQGIVDAYWVEDGEIVLLDYKTDFVKEPGELTKKYALQLELYGEALQKAAGRKVKEKLIYSFGMQQIVRL